MSKINYVAIMTIGCEASSEHVHTLSGHIRTRLSMPRNAISALTPSIARTPCGGSKILSLQAYVVYLCVLFIEQQMVT